MIEINLLPEEKRVKMRAVPKPGKAEVRVSENLKKLVYIVPAVAAALVVAHAYLAAAHVTAAVSLKGLERKLQSFQPRLQDLAGFKTQYESETLDEKIAQEMARASVDWSQKLNRLSLDLPGGIWLNDLTANSRQLALKCSVVALDSDPVELINRFLSELKNDPEFFGDFSGFDLGSVQKRTIGSFEIADFTVTMEVKPR